MIAQFNHVLITVVLSMETVAVVSEIFQKLQNRAARILMCANYDSNIDELFRALGWCKLKYQRFE